MGHQAAISLLAEVGVDQGCLFTAEDGRIEDVLARQPTNDPVDEMFSPRPMRHVVEGFDREQVLVPGFLCDDDRTVPTVVAYLSVHPVHGQREKGGCAMGDNPGRFIRGKGLHRF